MTTEINLGNLVIPIIKPQKGTDYYTEAEKQELISIVTNNVNSVIMPQEQTRQENEATRQSNEETRQSQENTRQSNEVSRQTAESARVEAENLRQSNESSRISAEQARVETFNTQMQAVDTAIAGIHTSQDAYDQNAQNKTEAFNTNATNKMNAYNENASEKIAEYDEHVHDYETELANKVDKVQGKGLSTNDYNNTEKGKVSANTEARHTHSNKSVLDGTTASYTTEEKSKLAELENYDDTELREDIEQNVTNIDDLEQRVEDAENNQLTYTPTPATSHYLQDSADARFRKFIPIGRTTQESTTGKNHWNNDKVKTSGIVEKLDTGFKITRNDSTRWGNDLSMSITAGSYKFYGDVKTNASSDRSSFLITYTDDTTRLVAFRLITSHATVDFEKDVKYVRPYIDNDESIGTYYEFTDLMILNSTETDTTYEPYTGGEPAPNPNYPMAIKNTGDNGSVNEKVQNENLFDKSKATDGYINYNNGSFTTSDQYTSSDYIQIEKGQQYYCNYVTFGSSAYGLAFYDKNKNYISGRQLINLITIPNNAKYIRFCVRNSNYSTETSITDINTLYFVKGNSPTDYVPHSEQNISFSLAQGQKFYEGSYPDDDEKVHHKRIERVFDGSDDENWSLQSINSNGIANFAIGLADYSGRDENLSLCDYFSSQSTPIAQTTNEGYYLTISKTLYIRIKSTTASTVAELRTWLSNHNMKFQYELAEEQTEDFTEEQKTAWNQIKKARTYKNITHISSEDETPANVDITYVRDLETVINNLTTRVETIESEV